MATNTGVIRRARRCFLVSCWLVLRISWGHEYWSRVLCFICMTLWRTPPDRGHRCLHREILLLCFMIAGRHAFCEISVIYWRHETLNCQLLASRDLWMWLHWLMSSNPFMNKVNLRSWVPYTASLKHNTCTWPRDVTKMSHTHVIKFILSS